MDLDRTQPQPQASPFDALRQVRPDGSEFWSSRDLADAMTYDQWRNFASAIARARVSLANQGYEVEDHIAGASKMVQIGSGSQRAVDDFHLTRFGAYLVVMNGDPRKPEVAAAQAYFAEDAREAEVAPTHFAIPKTYAEALRAAADADEARAVAETRALTAEAKIAEAEREEKARRMHREVTLLFERDPIGRLIAAWLIAREGSDR